ncbi:hypothetical protein MMC16_005490 [Acarospora aff. strigata]|nr:hypothetical protein [Acarospora aff. strigata]
MYKYGLLLAQEVARYPSTSSSILLPEAHYPRLHYHNLQSILFDPDTMLSHIFCVATLALSALAYPRPLPDCGQKDRPCKCPSGTSFLNSTTYAVIGGSAKDIKAIAGSYFNTDWFGFTPDSVTGPDNTKGSWRTLTGETDVGTYTFLERLYEIKEKRDGSFLHKYDQKNNPVIFYPQHGNGSFAGYWDTLDVKYVDDCKTDVLWNIYACFTNGKSEMFSGFHESALNNITAILKTQGKLRSNGTAPWSISSDKQPS